MDVGPEIKRRALILVGLPGSGKSTWTNAYRALRPTTVLSSDDIIERKAAEVGKTYSEVFDGAIDGANKEFEQSLTEAIVRGDNNIVIDRTNLSQKSRKTIIERLILNGYEVFAVIFAVPEQDEWKRRLEARPGKVIPDEVLKSMSEKYEEPTIQEGFKQIIRLS